MEENKEQQQSANGKKVLEKFNESMKKMEAIMGNPNWFKPTKKVSKDAIPSIITNMAEKKKAALIESVETALVNVIEEKQKFDKIRAEKEAAFQKAVIEEMQKLLVKLDAVFAMVDQIGSIEQSYYSALKGIVNPKVESPLAGLQEEITDLKEEGKIGEETNPETP